MERRTVVVDQVCFTLPIPEGKTEDARAFFRELEAQRKSAYAASRRAVSWLLLLSE
jgi:hypothetical protein